MSLDTLKAEFPVFEILNRTNTVSTLSVANGETIHFGPRAQRRVQAEHIHQIPDPSEYKLVTPSMDDLIRHGLVTPKVTPAASDPEPTEKPKSK